MGKPVFAGPYGDLTRNGEEAETHKQCQGMLQETKAYLSGSDLN